MKYNNTVWIKLYERDLARFLEEAYLRVGGAGPSAAASQDLRQKSGKLSVSSATQLLASDRDTWGQGTYKSDRER